MMMLARNPAAAYRRVELDARIEASSAGELTRICLEEAIAALGQALLALGKDPAAIPREPLARAQSITVWLARSVAPEHPLHASLVTFYGGLASQISANLRQPSPAEIGQVRGDLNDLLAAAG